MPNKQFLKAYALQAYGSQTRHSQIKASELIAQHAEVIAQMAGVSFGGLRSDRGILFQYIRLSKTLNTCWATHKYFPYAVVLGEPRQVIEWGREKQEQWAEAEARLP